MNLQILISVCASVALNVAFLKQKPIAALLAGVLYALTLWVKK